MLCVILATRMWELIYVYPEVCPSDIRFWIMMNTTNELIDYGITPRPKKKKKKNFALLQGYNNFLFKTTDAPSATFCALEWYQWWTQPVDIALSSEEMLNSSYTQLSAPKPFCWTSLHPNVHRWQYSWEGCMCLLVSSQLCVSSSLSMTLMPLLH